MVSLTPKQEKFCQVYMQTGNATEAYRQSYDVSKMKPESINRKAKECVDNVNISARLEELKNIQFQKHVLTVDDLIKELDEARQIALAAFKPQSAAAVAATLGKAKLLGLCPDKIELTGKNGGPVQNVTMNTKEFSQIAAKIAKDV